MRSRESHPRAGLSAAAPPAPPTVRTPAGTWSLRVVSAFPADHAGVTHVPCGAPKCSPASGLSGLNAGFIVPQVWPTVRDDCPGEDSVLVTALTRTGHARPRRSPEWGGRQGSEQRPLLRVPWKGRADGASRLRAVWAECRPARAQGPCCLVRPRVIRVGTVAWKAQFWAVVYSL